MLNVLHIIKYPGRGGSEQYILSLAKKMHNYSCRFHLAYSEDGPLVAELTAMGVKCFRLPMKNPLDLNAAQLLKTLCHRHKIHIVHSHFLRENYISVLESFLDARAVHINTVHMLEKKSGLLRFTNKFFFGANDGIIAVSAAVKQMLEAEGIKKPKIKLIYNGVDGAWFEEKIDTSDFRKQNGISGGDFVAVSAARFSEEKGHKFLLESIALYKKKRSRTDPASEADKRSVKFILSGDGDLIEECRTQAKDLGLDNDVKFVGYMPDVRVLLQSADLFLSHSYSESLGISILEALASGLPVIASNSGGPAEIVNNETGCGLLTPANDTEAFAEALLSMTEDEPLYENCKSMAKLTVLQRFTLDAMASQTLEMYEALAGARDNYNVYSDRGGLI